MMAAQRILIEDSLISRLWPSLWISEILMFTLAKTIADLQINGNAVLGMWWTTPWPKYVVDCGVKELSGFDSCVSLWPAGPLWINPCSSDNAMTCSRCGSLILRYYLIWESPYFVFTFPHRFYVVCNTQLMLCIITSVNSTILQ